MTQQLDDVLTSMTPLLNSLSQQPNAPFEYQGVCDGLVWADEIPSVSLTDEQEQLLRYLIHYRTSLIVEEPVPALAALWYQARRAFPRWPGFASGRWEPSRELSEYVTIARRNLEACLGEQ